MELEERLQLILLRIKKLKSLQESFENELDSLQQKNKQLAEENEALKKINFEQKKQIEIATIANQLSDEESPSDEIKRKLDKYIREVDAVIAALKQME